MTHCELAILVHCNGLQYAEQRSSYKRHWKPCFVNNPMMIPELRTRTKRMLSRDRGRGDETKNCVVYAPDQISSPGNSDLLKETGAGAFSRVYECRLKTFENIEDTTLEKDGESYKAALKKYKNRDYDDGPENAISNKMVAELRRESWLVSRLSHKNIVFFFGICDQDPYYGLLFELCEGLSLAKLLSSLINEFPLLLSVLVDWAKQIADGMAYLVGENYLHRDLKADNILVKQRVCFCATKEASWLEKCSRCHGCPLNKLQLKITDFGFTKSIISVGSSVVGTYAYMAPEVFKKSQDAWNESADVWSFGVVLWVIMARRQPKSTIYEQVSSLDGQKLIVPVEWPEKWVSIMRGCWDMNPKNRPRFQKLAKKFDQYANMIAIDPSMNVKTTNNYRISEPPPTNPVARTEEEEPGGATPMDPQMGSLTNLALFSNEHRHLDGYTQWSAILSVGIVFAILIIIIILLVLIHWQHE